MNIEYEIRVLEIDVNKITQRLEQLGAKKVGEFNQKRYIYDLRPAEKGKWIRLRTNGIKTTLTYKNIISNTIDGTKEVEIEVDDFFKTNEFMKQIGFENRNYQENHRIQYVIDDIEIDIDSWPLIPTYLEIEGPDEESITKMLKLLEIEQKKITLLNCDNIYKDIYHIDINEIKELRFKLKED